MESQEHQDLCPAALLSLFTFSNFCEGSQHSVLHLRGPCSSLRRKIMFVWQVFETGAQQGSPGPGLASPQSAQPLFTPAQPEPSCLFPAHIPSVAQLWGQEGSSSTRAGTGSAGSCKTGNSGGCLHRDPFPGGIKTQINLCSGVISTGITLSAVTREGRGLQSGFRLN